jgi:hypothetical protein
MIIWANLLVCGYIHVPESHLRKLMCIYLEDLTKIPSRAFWTILTFSCHLYLGLSSFGTCVCCMKGTLMKFIPSITLFYSPPFKTNSSEVHHFIFVCVCDVFQSFSPLSSSTFPSPIHCFSLQNSLPFCEAR